MRLRKELRGFRPASTVLHVANRTPSLRVHAVVRDVPDVKQRIRSLEEEADAHHQRAQRYNKEGRFAEAKLAYAKMHKIEDEATCLAREAGIQLTRSSVADTPGGYSSLHRLTQWPGKVSSAAFHDRLMGCIVGSLVADAAAMGVHWVYDQDQLAKLEQQAVSEGRPGLAFFEPPQSPFYSYSSGRNSPYGEQTLVLLQSIAERGGLDCGHYADTFFRRFGAPGYDGYLDVSAKGFLRNFGAGELPPASGAADAQANCTARLGPLVAAFGGDDSLLTLVGLATRVTQNTDAAVAWAGVGAVILEAVVRGVSPSVAVQQTIAELEAGTSGRFDNVGDLKGDVAAALQRTVTLASTSPTAAFMELGRNCHMPTALQTPLHVVLHVEHLARSSGSSTVNGTSDGVGHGGGHDTHHSNGGGDGDGVPEVLAPEWYRCGIEMAVRQGGCCASRSSFAGACLGAMVGSAGVDPAWAAKYTKYSDVVRCARSIVDARLSGVQ